MTNFVYCWPYTLQHLTFFAYVRFLIDNAGIVKTPAQYQGDKAALGVNRVRYHVAYQTNSSHTRLQSL